MSIKNRLAALERRESGEDIQAFIAQYWKKRPDGSKPPPPPEYELPEYQEGESLILSILRAGRDKENESQ